MVSAWVDLGIIILQMDLTEPKDEEPRSPKGFRKRWKTNRAESVASSDLVSSPNQILPATERDVTNLFGDEEECFSQTGSWNYFPFDEDVYEPESPVDFSAASSGGPTIYDPRGVEPAWQHLALETDAKRRKLDFPKMPWEIGSMCQIFRTGDIFQGTILDNYKHAFLPPSLGCSDVLNSVSTVNLMDQNLHLKLNHQFCR